MTAEPTGDLCALCNNEVSPHAESTWKQVTGWVGGPKKDSMRLRVDTGRYAHDHCVRAMMSGQPAGQPDLFAEVEEKATPHLPVEEPMLAPQLDSVDLEKPYGTGDGAADMSSAFFRKG